MLVFLLLFQMSKIQVRSFRHELIELRSQQKKQESKVNVSKLESRVGRLPFVLKEKVHVLETYLSMVDLPIQAI